MTHGLQEDGEKALSGLGREAAVTGGSRDGNHRHLGPGRTGPQTAGRQQGLSRCPSSSGTVPCPRLSHEWLSLHVGEQASLECSVSGPALVPSPASPPRVHSPLAQAIQGQRYLLGPFRAAPIVTRRPRCHRAHSTAQQGQHHPLSPAQLRRSEWPWCTAEGCFGVNLL